MTEGRLETESRCQECLAIIKGEVTSNNLSKRRVRTRTHGVVGGRGLVAPSYPIEKIQRITVPFAPALKKINHHNCLTIAPYCAIMVAHRSRLELFG